MQLLLEQYLNFIITCSLLDTWSQIPKHFLTYDTCIFSYLCTAFVSQDYRWPSIKYALKQYTFRVWVRWVLERRVKNGCFMWQSFMYTPPPLPPPDNELWRMCGCKLTLVLSKQNELISRCQQRIKYFTQDVQPEYFERRDKSLENFRVNNLFFADRDSDRPHEPKDEVLDYRKVIVRLQNNITHTYLDSQGQ